MLDVEIYIMLTVQTNSIYFQLRSEDPSHESRNGCISNDAVENTVYLETTIFNENSAIHKDRESNRTNASHSVLTTHLAPPK